MLSEHVFPPRCGDIFSALCHGTRSVQGGTGRSMGCVMLSSGSQQQLRKEVLLSSPQAAQLQHKDQAYPAYHASPCHSCSTSCLLLLGWKKRDLEILYVGIKMFYVHPQVFFFFFLSILASPINIPNSGITSSYRSDIKNIVLWLYVNYGGCYSSVQYVNYAHTVLPVSCFLVWIFRFLTWQGKAKFSHSTALCRY